jgi:uncharacterized membrane protein (DUF2068 family)
MTDENKISPDESTDGISQSGKPGLPLPGMAGVALYMLAISMVVALGVTGHHIPPIFLIVSVLTACASFGLLRQKRWGWALSLAATFLLMLYQFYLLFRTHQAAAGVMGALNLVLFLYLIRPEVIERLK